MLDRFQLSESYQFFRVTRTVPKSAINRCLREASQNKTGHAVGQAVRETKRIGSKQIFASYIIFRIEHPPTFLSGGTERDVKHCYALIIEYGDYLVVTRSGGKNFQECLDDYVDKISPDILNAAFMENGSIIKKASAQTTSPSRSALQKITYEGNNLETNMPVQGVSGRMLNSFRHETKGEHFSILGNQAKVNISNSKVAIRDYLARILFSIDKFGKRRKANPFLSIFAKPLPLKQHVHRIIPAEILLLTHELREYVEGRDQALPQLVYKLGRKERVLKLSFNAFLNSIEDSFEITKVGTGANKRFLIDNILDDTLELVITDKGYKLQSNRFEGFYIRYGDGETENLQRLINRKNLFSLSFNNVEITYSKGKLWQDNKLLSSIDGFLQMFIPDTEMNNITSEKGLITPASTGFQPGSTFEYVERVMGGKVDHLILDDLEYEYADYIGVRNLIKLQLIHCKESNKVFSASAFQEIVGQAIKNLFFFIHPEKADEKKTFWLGLYTGSNIARNRTGNRTFLADMKTTMTATNSDKEIYLVVNFISKNLLAANLTRVKNKNNPPKATLPILWLLNSLRNICLERNVKVYIICKP